MTPAREVSSSCTECMLGSAAESAKSAGLVGALFRSNLSLHTPDLGQLSPERTLAVVSVVTAAWAAATNWLKLAGSCSFRASGMASQSRQSPPSPVSSSRGAPAPPPAPLLLVPGEQPSGHLACKTETWLAMRCCAMHCCIATWMVWKGGSVCTLRQSSGSAHVASPSSTAPNL